MTSKLISPSRVLAQPVAVADLLGGGARERAAVLQHAVLLDDHPAVVAPVRERAAEALEVDVALAQAAEQPAAPRRERVGALGLDPFEHPEPDVLDVHGADPVAPAPERL